MSDLAYEIALGRLDSVDVSNDVVGNQPGCEVIELPDVVDRVLPGERLHRHQPIWYGQTIGPIAAPRLTVIAGLPVAPIVVGFPSSAASRVARKLPEVHRVVGKGLHPPARREDEPDRRDPTQLQGWEFEKPAATEASEDPGTDVAPTRYDAPLDPNAPTRTPSLEGCGPLGEDAP